MQHIRFVQILVESLGIEYLSAVLKSHGHRVDLVTDIQSRFCRNRLYKIILQGKPDLIAFSVTASNIKWAYETAEEIKKHSCVPIVFGGIQATLIPESVIKNDFVDYVIAGEGEFALLDLVNSLESGKIDYSIKNVLFKRNGSLIRNCLRDLIENLDALPFADKEITHKTNHYSLITKRGCLYNCTYCCVPILKNLYKNKNEHIRTRSVENVMAELRIAKNKYNKKRIIFEDDLFTLDKEWVRDFSGRYRKEISLPSIVCVHPNTLDKEMISLLKNMNCLMVQMGVQSMNERIRSGILNRYYSNEKLKEIFNLLKENDISCIADNIVGLPTEREEDIINMIRFYNEIRPGKIDIFYLKYFPNAEIIKKSNLDKRQVDRLNRGIVFSSAPIINPDDELGRIDIRKLNKLILTASLVYIFPKCIIRYLINRKRYRFLPSVKYCYQLNDFIFMIIFLIKGKWNKLSVYLRGNGLKYCFTPKKWTQRRVGASITTGS